MGKILALAAATIALLGGNRMASISIDPDPPKAGKSATITYTAGASLLIEYTPGGVVRVTCGSDGKVDVVVPVGALTMSATDPNTGTSQGWTVTQ